MNEEVFQLGERVAMKVESIRLQPEFLLRPLHPDHVKELEESYSPNPNTHPAIIVQPFEDEYTVRAHAHTFQALVNLGREKVNVRVVKGPEYEVLSYLGKEQAYTKRLTPIEWGNYLLRFYNATPNKSLREMEKHFPFKKSRIQMLISGVQNKDVLNLMGKMEWSFDKAYVSVQELDSKTEPEGSSVQQLDSKEVEESQEELTNREAGEYEGHASEDSSVVHPIRISGESEDDGEKGDLVDTEKHSPDGEPEIPSEDQTQPEEPTSPEPESSPSKNGWKRGYYHPCGTFLEEGKGIVKKRNTHTCKDVLSVGLNVNHKILEMIERKETVDVKNGSILRTDWHISDSYSPFQVDNGRLDESIEKWNENKRITGLVVRALENVKQKRENDEIERLKNIEKESLKVGGR